MSEYQCDLTYWGWVLTNYVITRLHAGLFELTFRNEDGGGSHWFALHDELSFPSPQKSWISQSGLLLISDQLLFSLCVKSDLAILTFLLYHHRMSGGESSEIVDDEYLRALKGKAVVNAPVCGKGNGPLYDCTVCGSTQMAHGSTVSHPILPVGVCRMCYSFIQRTDYSVVRSKRIFLFACSIHLHVFEWRVDDRMFQVKRFDNHEFQNWDHSGVVFVGNAW